MIVSATTRVFVACCAFALVFTGFSYRLVQLQVTDHDELAAEAAKNHDMSETIFARRGAILDISGEPLAQNEPVCKIVADGTLVKDRKLLAGLIAKAIGMDENAVEAALGRQKYSERQKKNVSDPYIVLKNKVPQEAITNLTRQINDIIARDEAQKNVPKDKVDQDLRALADCGLRAISFEQEAVRRYPCGSTLCHVIGETDGENKGVDGVEKA
jgi:cell division protein FtsI/penicillin-binding protein 2